MSSSVSPNSSRLLHLFTSAVVLILISLFLMPDALACHRGDPPKPHGKNATCNDPNPGPERPPTAVETMLAIEGTVIYENPTPANGEARVCMPGARFTEEAGDYDCSVSGIGITLESTGVTGVWSKRDYDICKALTRNVILMPSTNGFQYGWTDSCYADSCAVEVRVVFEGEQISSLTNGQSDTLDMVMRATAAPVAGGTPDSNPFLTSRSLQITSVTAQYLKTGTTRAAAVCDYYVTPPKTRERYPANLISEPSS